MKKLLIASLSLTLLACSTSKNKNQVPDSHTSQTSIDVDGIYRGTIPCADCEGIKTTITLQANNQYTLETEYLKQTDENTLFKSKGKYEWVKEGSVIALIDQNEKSYFKVGENTLTQLSQDLSPVQGETARFYLMTKDNYTIFDKKWEFVELMGQKVDIPSTMKKEAYLELSNKDNRYHTTIGCNNISGAVKVYGFNYIQFDDGISTMMACPQMDLESKLIDVLKTADSFQIHGDELLLIKGRMAPLARLKMVK